MTPLKKRSRNCVSQLLTRVAKIFFSTYFSDKRPGGSDIVNPDHMNVDLFFASDLFVFGKGLIQPHIENEEISGKLGMLV